MPLAPRWTGLALLAAPGLAAPPPQVTGRASVIDADTLEISGQRIRLAGVDAPESSQTCLDVNGDKWRCGQQAALALADLIAWHPVTCSISGQDRYDPQIGTCSAAGTEINQWLVRQGWPWPIVAIPAVMWQMNRRLNARVAAFGRANLSRQTNSADSSAARSPLPPPSRSRGAA